MAQGSQQQQGSPDNAFAPIWIMLISAIVGYLIWHFGHTFIVTFVFHIKLFEAKIISLFSGHMVKAIPYLTNANPATVTWEQLAEVSDFIGNYVRYPVIVVLAILGTILYFSDVTLRYRKTYSMNKLREEEKGNWPQITPIVSLNLVDQDVTTGPWAMAMQPMEFAKKHNLLKKEMLLSEMTRNKPLIYALKRGEAKRVFTMQLGNYWQSPEDLPIHTKALYAALAAKIDRNRDGSANLMQQISRSTMSGKLNFSGVNELLNKHRNSETVAKVTYRHAYVYSALGSMLEKARSDGVFPSSEFLWLKPIDRPLWYMLNSVGRRTPHSEIGGAFAHWLAEKELGRKSMVPIVDEAVNALELAIKEIKILPEEYVAFKD